MNRHDPSIIISDEVVGMWLCLWIIEPTQIASAIIAFIIFRAESQNLVRSLRETAWRTEYCCR